MSKSCACKTKSQDQVAGVSVREKLVCDPAQFCPLFYPGKRSFSPLTYFHPIHCLHLNSLLPVTTIQTC